MACAPAMLKNNICWKRNLDNGTAVIYHSIFVDPKEGQHIIDEIENAKQGEDVYLEHPPLYVNVTVDGVAAKEKIGLTLFDGKAVIPIGQNE